MALYNYGMYYHNLSELPPEHRPSTRLLEDDDKLDKWYEQFMADQDRKRGRRQQSDRHSEAQVPQWGSGEYLNG